MAPGPHRISRRLPGTVSAALSAGELGVWVTAAQPLLHAVSKVVGLVRTTGGHCNHFLAQMHSLSHVPSIHCPIPDRRGEIPDKRGKRPSRSRRLTSRFVILDTSARGGVLGAGLVVRGLAVWPALPPAASRPARAGLVPQGQVRQKQPGAYAGAGGSPRSAGGRQPWLPATDSTARRSSSREPRRGLGGAGPAAGNRGRRGARASPGCGPWRTGIPGCRSWSARSPG